MLQNDDIDDDYFTPAPNESLANIFQRESKVKSQNDTLKYVAPKPNNPVEDTKTTECIFACALTGFEWYNNVYTPKGKIGLALMKIFKTGICNMILYDSNKLTLSCTTIAPQLIVKVKENSYISFYDNTHKYWSLYGNSEELKEILKHLEKLGVSIDKTTGLSDEEGTRKSFSKKIDSDIEDSDTDSVKIKSKTSILSRMAHMGHAILPPSVTTAKNSDSSDASDIPSVVKSSRHKVSKFNKIRDHQDKIVSPLGEIESHNNSSIPKPGNSIEPISTRSFVSQLLPITSTSSFVGDLNVLMSEQRMNNNEIRMNMGRLSDKVDQVIHKISDLESQTNKNSSSCLTNEIFRKLLEEYESKIKYYEEIIKAKDINLLPESKFPIDQSVTLKNDINQSNEHNVLLMGELERKNRKILDLESEIVILKDELRNTREDHKSLTEEIKQITKTQEEKTNELTESNSHTLKSSPETTIAIEDIVKTIMNDTFQNAVDKFEENNDYSGKDVIRILGAVIRNVTLKRFSDK